MDSKRMGNGIFRQLFTPSYEELALFLASVMVIFLYLADKTFVTEVFGYLGDQIYDLNDLGVIVAVVFMLIGFGLSMYHVFTPRQKSVTEKIFLMCYGIALSFFVSLGAIIAIAKNPRLTVLLIFPIWNLINIVLLYFTYGHLPDKSNSLLDENAKILDVIVGTCVLLVVFSACKYIFHLYWGIIFSIAIWYATTVNTWIISKFSNQI